MSERLHTFVTKSKWLKAIENVYVFYFCLLAETVNHSDTSYMYAATSLKLCITNKHGSPACIQLIGTLAHLGYNRCTVSLKPEPGHSNSIAVPVQLMDETNLQVTSVDVVPFSLEFTVIYVCALFDNSLGNVPD